LAKKAVKAMEVKRFARNSSESTVYGRIFDKFNRYEWAILFTKSGLE
jgi:hypothetical protein